MATRDVEAATSIRTDAAVAIKFAITAFFSTVKTDMRVIYTEAFRLKVDLLTTTVLNWGRLGTTLPHARCGWHN